LSLYYRYYKIIIITRVAKVTTAKLTIERFYARSR